jgi:hypothetical protein
MVESRTLEAVESGKEDGPFRSKAKVKAQRGWSSGLLGGWEENPRVRPLTRKV